VTLVFQRIDQKQYALKQMDPCDASRQEIQLMASFNEKNIVRYYTSWQTDG
jgi:serine/threonine protein kinase